MLTRPRNYAVAAAAAVKEEPEVSDVESEGVPGSGEPFPAAAVTLLPAAKRQRTARGEQRTAFQKLQALKAELEQHRAEVASRIESPLETAAMNVAMRESLMHDVLTELVPGGGESFSAAGDEPGGEGVPLAACVSASLLEDFLWPETDIPNARTSFASFKAVMAPGPRHDPEITETRDHPYTDNVQGVRFDEANLSRLWIDKLRPDNTIHLEIVTQIDEELMRDLSQFQCQLALA